LIPNHTVDFHNDYVPGAAFTTREQWYHPDGKVYRKNWYGFDEFGGALPGFRICLMSVTNKKYDPIAALAEPNWLAYCKKHNYAFRLYTGAYHEDPSQVDTYGDKVKFECYYDMRGLFDVVMFLDIDSLFTNMDIRIEDRLMGQRFFWTYDDNGPLSGLMIMHTDDVTEKHLRKAYELAARENNVRHGQIEPNGISDQDAMTRLMNVPPFRDTFRFCYPAKEVGHCFPQNWEPGDWIYGVPGCPVDEKLALMKEMLCRIPS
jgi:hypothetical protein